MEHTDMNAQGDGPPDRGCKSSHSERRADPRVDHYREFSFEVDPSTQPAPAGRCAGLLVGYAYDLSQSGIRFLCGTQLAEKQIVLRLILPGNGLTCLKADVVHTQEVVEGLWECGAAFHERLNEEDVERIELTADEFLWPTDTRNER